MEKSFTYKNSGVDVRAGEELVNSIKGIVKETHNIQVLSNIGGFGGLFKPDFGNYNDPVLVSSIDGVGTKLIVAFKSQKYDTVGQDLVNHCVNDIAVCGAEPLFFLDYFSTGKLEQQVAFDVIKGFTIACKENGCALIGGETAEMPDIYAKGEFDLAGTIVGIVDKNDIIDGSNVTSGNNIYGIPSTGLHTNGYSLARKVLFSKYSVDDKPVELMGESIGSALLKVHRSYLKCIREVKKIKGVNAFSHITGGGIEGNTRRVVPNGLNLDVDYTSWSRPPIFNLIQSLGNVPEEDMRLSMNLGIGLVIVASPSAEKEIIDWAKLNNEIVYKIGSVK